MSMQWFRHDPPDGSCLDVEVDAKGATVKVWEGNVPHRVDINATQCEQLAIALLQATPGPEPEYPLFVENATEHLSPDEAIALGLALIRAAGRVKEQR